jgi:hypothetical protein
MPPAEAPATGESLAVPIEAAQLRELRFILFSDEEVVVALLDHHAPHWRRTQQIDVHKAQLQIHPGGPQAFGVTLTIRVGGTPQRRNIRGVDVLGALLAYCGRVRIPLPLRGQKELELMHGRLAMRITLLLGTPEAATWDE